MAKFPIKACHLRIQMRIVLVLIGLTFVAVTLIGMRRHFTMPYRCPEYHPFHPVILAVPDKQTGSCDVIQYEPTEFLLLEEDFNYDRCCLKTPAYSTLNESGLSINTDHKCYASAGISFRVFEASTKKPKVPWIPLSPRNQTGLALDDEAEIIFVNCKGWGPNFHLRLVPQQPLLGRVMDAQNPSGPNLLLITVESMSRASALRFLPKTLDFMRSMKHFFEFPRYHAVGRGRLANEVPLLSGLNFDNYVQECLQDGDEGCIGPTDSPYLPRKLQNYGYVTLIAEQECNIRSSTAGSFMRSPWAHHVFNWFHCIYGTDYYSPSRRCFGQSDAHAYDLSFAQQLFDNYPNSTAKFAMVHLLEGNDPERNSLVQVVDEDLEKLLKHLYEAGHMKNTAVVLTAQVGAVGERSTLAAESETYLPALFMLMPLQFEQFKRESLSLDTLRANSGRLITPYDVHATLQTLLLGENSAQHIGANLLDHTVSADRTCGDANIPHPICLCELLPLTGEESGVAGTPFPTDAERAAQCFRGIGEGHGLPGLESGPKVDPLPVPAPSKVCPIVSIKPHGFFFRHEHEIVHQCPEQSVSALCGDILHVDLDQCPQVKYKLSTPSSAVSDDDPDPHRWSSYLAPLNTSGNSMILATAMCHAPGSYIMDNRKTILYLRPLKNQQLIDRALSYDRFLKDPHLDTKPANGTELAPSTTSVLLPGAVKSLVQHPHPRRLNVMIVLLDAMSNAQWHRRMLKTKAQIRSLLDTRRYGYFEFTRMHTMALNSFPNHCSLFSGYDTCKNPMFEYGLRTLKYAQRRGYATFYTDAECELSMKIRRVLGKLNKHGQFSMRGVDEHVQEEHNDVFPTAAGPQTQR